MQMAPGEKDGGCVVTNEEALTAIVEGTVEPGDRRGRELGFPTANVHSPHAVRLDGVYAAILQVDPAGGGPSYVSAVSVGHRPTFYGRDGMRLLEAHLLDFAGDLYGTYVRIDLHTRLRVQRKFVDLPSLVDQLRLDVEGTRAWATINGWEHLLHAVPTAPRESVKVDDCLIPQRPVIRRKKRSGAVKSAERQRQRELRLKQAIDDCGADTNVPPEWLAQRVGVPVAYAQWYLTSHGQ